MKQKLCAGNLTRTLRTIILFTAWIFMEFYQHNKYSNNWNFQYNDKVTKIKRCIQISYCHSLLYNWSLHLNELSKTVAIFCKISMNTWEIQLFLINTNIMENWSPNSHFTVLNLFYRWKFWLLIVTKCTYRKCRLHRIRSDGELPRHTYWIARH